MTISWNYRKTWKEGWGPGNKTQNVHVPSKVRQGERDQEGEKVSVVVGKPKTSKGLTKAKT